MKDKNIEDRVNYYLSQIDFNQDLNAFINVYSDYAVSRARDLDKKGIDSRGFLHGKVIGLKDMFCFKDFPVTSSSKILNNFISQISATCVEKIIDSDGVIIGHQNCDQFGMGSSNENSYYGYVKNPIDKSRVAGGSSGGSAAAVAAGLCDISLGTDTGGSVRQPASLCGVIGLKPTYSRISRYGVIAYASSFDTVGIFSRNIYDAALMLGVIAGQDARDNTSSSRGVPDYLSQLDDKVSFRVCYIPMTLEHEGIQAEVSEACCEVISVLQSEDISIKRVEFPLLDYTLPVYYILTTAEASANLARYDGIRYGYRTTDYENIEDLYRNTRTEGFGDEVKRRIMLGTAILNAGFQDEFYTKSQKVRSMIVRDFDKIFAENDFLIMPTSPTTAFPIGSYSDPVSMYLSDIYTVPASCAGLPAISIPVGKDNNGLPIGLQIITRPFEEDRLLRFANMLLRLI